MGIARCSTHITALRARSSAALTVRRPVIRPCRMWAALILVALAAGAAADETSCACSTGFPPLPAGGFKSISGYAGCIVNYVQFEDPTGAVVFTSGSLSGGEPFSVTCPGSNTITGFSFLCNTGSGPGAFPTPNFASLSTIGGVTCSNGSLPFYSGILNQNVCEFADDYTQLGYLDCGADGSAPPTCFNTNSSCGNHGNDATCAGTSYCDVVSPGTSTAWPQIGHDFQHTARSDITVVPSLPSLRWPVLELGLAAKGPAVSNNIIYAISSSGIVAVSADSGAVLNTIPLPQPAYGGNVAISAAGTLVVTIDAPYTFETTVYNITLDGTIVWATTLNGTCCNNQGNAGSGGVMIGPDGTVFVNTAAAPAAFVHGYVFALEPGGSIAWTATAANMVTSPPTLSRSHDTLVFGDFNGNFYCVSAASGEQLWTFSMGGVWWGMPLASSFHDIIFVNAPQAYGPQGRSLVAFSISTGAVLWYTPSPFGGQMAYAFTTLAEAADGSIVATDNSGNVFACDALTGQVLWKWAGQPGNPDSNGFMRSSIITDANGTAIYTNSVSLTAISTAANTLWSATLPIPTGGGVMNIALDDEGGIIGTAFRDINDETTVFLFAMR